MRQCKWGHYRVNVRNTGLAHTCTCTHIHYSVPLSLTSSPLSIITVCSFSMVDNMSTWKIARRTLDVMLENTYKGEKGRKVCMCVRVCVCVCVGGGGGGGGGG